MLGLFTNKWTWIVIALLAMTTVGTVAIHNYGVKRYNDGVFAERRAWDKIVFAARNERDAAQAELARQQAAHAAEANRLRLERDRALTRVQGEIRNAADLQTQYDLYIAHRSQLREQSADDLARARADYLSSIAANGGGGSRGIGPVDARPNERPSRHLYSGAGDVVGDCLGEF